MATWLITWDWASESAKRDERVAAILDGSFPSEQVRETVELLYANVKYTLSERLAAAEGRWDNPYPAYYGTVGDQIWDEYIICGHNPYLVARKVDNICVTEKDGKEEVTWNDRSKPSVVSLRQRESVTEGGGGIKTRITFQYLAPGAERPNDITLSDAMSNLGPGSNVPLIGDIVSLQVRHPSSEKGHFKSFKVAGRNFLYTTVDGMGSGEIIQCDVHVVVEDVRGEEVGVDIKA